MNSPDDYMQEALKIAHMGMEQGNLPIGAVLVLEGITDGIAVGD